MNAIHEISLKIQLGLDPSSPLDEEQLLQRWQEFNARKCQARTMQLPQGQKPFRPGDNERSKRLAG